MKTSPAGIAAIRQREGCRLTAYRDTVGVWSIGVGHTGRAAPPPVTAGMRITQAEADAILADDLAPFEAAVASAIRLTMTQNEWDAFVSLAFNIGAPAFVGSTVVRKFNAGDTQGAADAFLLWNKQPELMGRRKAERAQFLGTNAVAPAKPKGAKVATAAVVVAAGAGAGAVAAPHGSILMAALVAVAMIAAGVFIVLHNRK